MTKHRLNGNVWKYKIKIKKACLEKNNTWIRQISLNEINSDVQTWLKKTYAAFGIILCWASVDKANGRLTASSLSTAETPAKCQSDTIIIIFNFAASRSYGKTFASLVNKGPGSYAGDVTLKDYGICILCHMDQIWTNSITETKQHNEPNHVYIFGSCCVRE